MKAKAKALNFCTPPPTTRVVHARMLMLIITHTGDLHELKKY